LAGFIVSVNEPVPPAAGKGPGGAVGVKVRPTELGFIFTYMVWTVASLTITGNTGFSREEPVFAAALSVIFTVFVVFVPELGDAVK
jgi:hypothetical protein